MKKASKPKVRLLLGDCLERMAEIRTGSVDAIVTDPPYCSGGNTECERKSIVGQGLRNQTIKKDGWFSGDNMGTAGLAWLLRSVAKESRRILRPGGGSILFFSDWRMVSSLQPAIESAGLRYRNLIAWDKGHFGLGNGFRVQHELILHFTTGRPKYHDRSTGNVVRCPRERVSGRDHPTQKPTHLLGKLIAVVAPEGGVVADPFMGVGSTGVACVETGRSFIGIESDADYFAVAETRIRNTSKAEVA